MHQQNMQRRAASSLPFFIENATMSAIKKLLPRIRHILYHVIRALRLICAKSRSNETTNKKTAGYTACGW